MPTPGFLLAEASQPALVYLAHVSGGVSMRALSRQLGVHPSTVHRQIRRIEERREDPLYDEAIASLDRRMHPAVDPTPPRVQPATDMPAVVYPSVATLKEPTAMALCKPVETVDPENRILREARRILRRLAESKAFLAVAPEAELAVVFRETVPGGRPRQTATVEREVARSFALRDWIGCIRKGKVACYEITAAGRAALERLLAQDVIAKRASAGFAEAQTPFKMQHQEEALRHVMRADSPVVEEVRVNVAESPLAWLARRSSHGEAFLGPRELEAGERLREDFERAEMGARTTQNWERFLTAGVQGGGGARGPAEGPADARARFAAAMKALGPGLSDIAYRCCCFLEGLEAAEKRLGWSKRSGKVVLRIALQRLADHYGLFGGTPG